MMPTPAKLELHDDAAGHLAARIESMSASVDPVPVSRAKTVSPGTLLVAILVGCVAVATLGNWFHTQVVAFNDIIVKFLMVLIPLLLVVMGYFAVRFVGFWRANNAAEREAMAEAEAELLQRDMRFTAGSKKGTRDVCIRPKNHAALQARRRRTERMRTV
jgi:hypothetical protein